MKKEWVFKTTILVIFIFALVISQNYLSQKTKIEKIDKKIDPITALSLSMTRELRQVVASFVWLRIDEYFHSTALKLRENKEIVPLIKLVTIFDPTFIDAYLILAYHLSNHLGLHADALGVIKEGIEKNMNPPDSKISELYFQGGWIYNKVYSDTAEAIIYLRNGIKYFTDQCDEDNSHLAAKLLSFLEKKNSDTASISLTLGKLDEEKMHKMLGQDNEEAHEDHGNDDGGDEHASHKYFGQNPWHDPDAVALLKKSTAVYFCLALILAIIHFIYLKKARVL